MDQNYQGMPPTPGYQGDQTQTAGQQYGQPYGQPNGQQGYQSYQQYQQQGYADFTGQNYGGGGLLVNDYARMHLSSIGGWTKFISIVSIIFITLGIIFIIYSMTATNQLLGSSYYYGAARNTMTAVFIVYLVILAIFYLPSFWGLSAGSKMKLAAQSGSPNDLEEGLRKWKYVCIFMGVLTIIYLVIIGFSVIAILASGVLFR